jgi:hypothetical protein
MFQRTGVSSKAIAVALAAMRTLTKLHTRKPPRQNPRGLKNGASEEVRTLDIHLGKVVLYQLSYARFLEDDADNRHFTDAVNAFSEKSYFTWLLVS